MGVEERPELAQAGRALAARERLAMAHNDPLPAEPWVGVDPCDEALLNVRVAVRLHESKRNIGVAGRQQALEAMEEGSAGGGILVTLQ